MSAEQFHPREDFPNFGNTPWGSYRDVFEQLAGNASPAKLQKIAQEFSGHRGMSAVTFPSTYLNGAYARFLAPDEGYHDVRFDRWEYADEMDIRTTRRGFKTSIGDTLRMAYCEYEGSIPTSIGLMSSWVNPKTEESLYREVSVYRDCGIVDKRYTVYRCASVESPLYVLGQRHMQVEIIPQFRQVEVVYDSPQGNGIELAYGLQVVFDAYERTKDAQEYERDNPEQYKSSVGKKTLEGFLEEIGNVFRPDETLVNLNVRM